MKYYHYIVIGLGALVLTGCGSRPLAVETSPAVSIPPGYFYFYSKTCAHCTVVETYMNENNIRQKLYFVSKDVTEDKAAFDLMQAVGEYCQIKQTDLGTPLFYDGQKCYLGDKDVISYFESLNK